MCLVTTHFLLRALCGHADALQAMSCPDGVYKTFSPFCVVPVFSLLHPFFNNLNSRGQEVVHMVAELGSDHSICWMPRSLIVSVGVYLELPRGGNLTTLAHLAARLRTRLC